MIATVIDLREASRSQNDPIELQKYAHQQLAGEPFLFGRQSYGDEMTVHFGQPVEYTLPRFGKQVEGSAILTLRGSAWLLKSGAWPMIASAGLLPVGVPESFGKPVTGEDLAPGVFIEAGATVLGVRVFPTAIGFGLQVFLTDGSQLTVIPTPDDGEGGELADWELLGKHWFLASGPGKKWSQKPSK